MPVHWKYVDEKWKHHSDTDSAELILPWKDFYQEKMAVSAKTGLKHFGNVASLLSSFV